MRRVMIIGQPGSGKSTFARALGARTGLPVVHMDCIHWQSGWIERSPAEKTRLCREVEAGDRWIFEGGHSATWNERLDRADTLIWLDVSVAVRARRVLWRRIKYHGRTRPDLPANCPERLDREFVTYIWRTRTTSRDKMRDLFDSAPADKKRYRLATRSEVDAFLSSAAVATKTGHIL